MRRHLAGLTAGALGLAIALSGVARADDKDDKGSQAAPQTIRGAISGVTVEGEMAVDYKTNRAMSAEMSFLTVVGSPRDDANTHSDSGKSSDSKTGSDEKTGRMGRHRHNVYILWLSPKTKVHEAKEGSTDGHQADASSFDKLEIGDHVEATFVPREEIKSPHRGHGRHRTYFGEAVSITILPHQPHRSSSDSGK
jgi:hypothetical protein